MPTAPQSTRPPRAGRASRDEARRRILAAADDLLRERPFRRLTVDEVMARAELSRTVFYRHFEGLPAVVLALLAGLEEDLLAPLADPPADAEGLWAALRGAVEVAARHGGLLRAVDETARTDAEVAVAYDRVVDGFVTAAAGLVPVGDGADAPPPRDVARALTLMTLASLLDGVARDPELDAEAALAPLLVVWRAVLGEAGTAAASEDGASAS